MDQKPKLIPVRVPWMISSVPRFQMWRSDNGQLSAIAFIAFFKLEALKSPAKSPLSPVYIVENPPEFCPAETAEGAPYRLVRISFERTIFSAIDYEHHFPYLDFDWSGMPIDRAQVKSIGEYQKLVHQYWMDTGLAPDPVMYEVKDSHLLDKLNVDKANYKHIILVAEDEFFDVVAKDWKWEPGQAVD